MPCPGPSCPAPLIRTCSTEAGLPCPARGQLPCASGAYGTQEAGTRSPCVSARRPHHGRTCQLRWARRCSSRLGRRSRRPGQGKGKGLGVGSGLGLGLGLASPNPNPNPKPGRRSRPTCLRKLQSGLALRRRQRLRQGGGGGWGIHYLPEEVGDQVDCALVLQVPRHQVGRLVVSKEVVRTK